jgi:hypothetical protein
MDGANAGAAADGCMRKRPRSGNVGYVRFEARWRLFFGMFATPHLEIDFLCCLSDLLAFRP